MSRHTISERELIEEGLLETEPEYQPVSHFDNELQDIENQVIRYIMSRELKNQFIRREHITQLYTNRRVNYDVLIERVQHKLQDIYGLKFVSMPPKEGDKKSKLSQSKTKQPLMLTNCLSRKARSVLGEIWIKDSETTVPNNRNTGDNQYFLPKYSKTSALKANSDLIKSGITLLVITLLVISENHLSEHELVVSLKKFGISDGLNNKNSNINTNLADLMNDLTKKEYLVREVLRSSDNVSTVDYKLGRRSRAEFTPLSVFEFIKVIYGGDFDSDTQKKTLASIERAYGTRLEFDLDRADHQPDQPNPDDDVPENNLDANSEN